MKRQSKISWNLKETQLECVYFRFIYENTGQEPIFENWHSTQPNDDQSNEDQDCVKIHLKFDNLWFDDNCDLVNHFVCEKGMYF